MSPHHRVVSEDKKQALERDYIGLDTAVHRQNLEMYRGTGDYLPMAKWLGSLRNNSEYRRHLEGAPPGVAEASGVRMVQPPMHYTNASSVVRHGHFPGEVGGGGPSSSGDLFSSSSGDPAAYEEVARNFLNGSGVDENGEGDGEDGDGDVGSVIHRGRQRARELREERAARVRRAQSAIADCGGKIGSDHHEPSLYPLPGQHVSKYHCMTGNDKARALARPYVGMNMNQMRRHIATGNGDGRAASNWIGSLRSSAKGADGGYREYMVEMERRRGEEEKRERRMTEPLEGEEEERERVDISRDGGEAGGARGSGGAGGADGERGRERRGPRRVSINRKAWQEVARGGGGRSKQRMGRRRSKREGAGRGKISNNATMMLRKKKETEYVGDKTSAQMSGVPIGMRWTKANEFGDDTRGYLRMQEKLYRPPVSEEVRKFRLRGETPDHNTWMRSSNDLTSKKSMEEERRRRRMEYGNVYAERFKKKKKKGGWVENK